MPPTDDFWRIWLYLAGRGSGKTRSAAEQVKEVADSGKVRHISIVGQTAAAVRDVCVLGPSGIMAVAGETHRPLYESSKSCITWHNGVKLHLLSAEEPERTRGFNFGYAWIDEACAFANLMEFWDLHQMCMRAGANPRTIITTTPKNSKWLKMLLAREGKDVYVSRGSTFDNRANLAPSFFDSVVARYVGTRLGRQELNAEVLSDTPGALWTQDILDASRVPADHPLDLKRIVIAVDPAVSVSEDSDETGIIVAGVGHDNHAYILDDLSGKFAPHEWATRVVAAFRRYEADRVIIEKNQGGAMCESTLRSVDANLPIKLITASKGKVVRAEPVSSLYEQGRCHHVGSFDLLEDQLTTFSPGSSSSPDRLDSLVYAVIELLLDAGWQSPITTAPTRAWQW